MLDTARHFLRVETLLRQLDGMAAAKLNVLHWHMTDSSAVPVGSERFPALASKGAFGPTMVYSVADMRRVVEYARQRGVRVVPEWDMPGHSSAWGLGAPPGVMLRCECPPPCGGAVAGGVPKAIFDMTSEATYAFLDAFFGEMATIFPERVWHLGGDEVNAQCLNASESVRAWLRRNPGVALDDLVPMFYTRVYQLAAKHGRSAMGWDDAFASIYTRPAPNECHGYNKSADPTGATCVAPVALHAAVNASLPPDAIVHAWQSACYVEYAQLSPVRRFRSVISTGYYLTHGGGEYEEWENTYDKEPGCVAPNACVYDLPPEQQEALLGVEACLWGEEQDDDTIDNQLWLRLSLLGERLWSTNATIAAHQDTDANYENPDLNTRLVKHRCRLMQRGIHPEGYSTYILNAASKWQQCVGWLPQGE